MITTLRNRALVALMLGHFTNDMLGGLLTLFLPVAKSRFDLANSEVGLIALSYAAASSLSQPVFGWFTDRHLQRWVPALVLLWGGTFASLYGVASSYGMLLLFAALAGL
ncbi:MAG: MFS transporter, partial [Thermomicrobiales bacterium]